MQKMAELRKWSLRLRAPQYTTVKISGRVCQLDLACFIDNSQLLDSWDANHFTRLLLLRHSLVTKV